MRRYDECMTRVARRGRGEGRRADTIKGTPMEGINVNTYVVNADAVAEAIVRRLLAGRTLPDKR
ncbi:MAG: hypothetical protein QOI80_188 [Solirubrobacteraceae bacterium]|nr:hypothetical protein [Solirubrobacteraceae bacterium]